MDAQQIIEQLADCLDRRVELVAPRSATTVAPEGEAVDRSRGIVPIDFGARTPCLRYEVDGRAPLSAREFDLVSGAIDLLRLTPPALSTSWLGTREAVLLRILTSELDGAGLGTDVVAQARARRWVDPRGTLTVHALLFDGRSNDVERFTFVRSLASSSRDHGVFAGIRDGVGFLMTGPSRDREEVRAWIVRAAAERRAGLIAVGSADVDRRSDDVRAAAQEARIAADIRASLGREQTTGRSEDLGAWRLLHAVAGSHRLVATASPAAEELWNASDPVQRETIEAYLDAGCRASTACQRLHIHRTTLYYRLDNMPASVRDALGDGLKRSTLHLALKLLRLREGPVGEREPVTDGVASRTPTPIRSANRPATSDRERAVTLSA